MSDEENMRMQKILEENEKKIAHLENFADAKAEENAKLISKIYQNHNDIRRHFFSGGSGAGSSLRRKPESRTPLDSGLRRNDGKDQE